MKLSRILKIQPGVTALIGGGGKTTMMYRLADELSEVGTVIVCSSTNIVEPEDEKVVTDGSCESIIAALKTQRAICVGTRIDGGKLSTPAIGFDRLRQIADYVIVEADGAHRLPIKAHADYEPVIPEGTDKTILVLGADAFGQPICTICHRPELFAGIAGVGIQSIVTSEIVSRVIIKERLGDCLFINKVEDENREAYARSLADLIHLPVVAGSLKREEYVCLR